MNSPCPAAPEIEYTGPDADRIALRYVVYDFKKLYFFLDYDDRLIGEITCPRGPERNAIWCRLSGTRFSRSGVSTMERAMELLVEAHLARRSDPLRWSADLPVLEPA